MTLLPISEGSALAVEQIGCSVALEFEGVRVEFSGERQLNDLKRVFGGYGSSTVAEGVAGGSVVVARGELGCCVTLSCGGREAECEVGLVTLRSFVNELVNDIVAASAVPATRPLIGDPDV